METQLVFCESHIPFILLQFFSMATVVHHTTYFSLALQGLVRERIFHTVEFCTIVIGKMRSQKTTSLHGNMFIYLFNIYLHKYASRTYKVPNTS